MDYNIHRFASGRQFIRPVVRWPSLIDAFPAELLEDAWEKHGLSEIHKIVWGISYDSLDTKVRACPEAFDGQDSFGHTPLHYAILFGKPDHVRVLLSHGADIGRLPDYLFWIAVVFGDCASVQLLLDRGLRPNYWTRCSLNYNTTGPLSIRTYPSIRIYPFYINPYEDYKPTMDKLLINYGYDFNTRDSNGITALMVCCRGNIPRYGIKRMKTLLEHGIDPEVTDLHGQTAIHQSLSDDNVPAFEMLIKYGARLDARTSKGETVLHMAVERTREVAMVHALSKAGIMQLDLDARRHDGKIAFDVLRRRAAETKSKHFWTTEEKYAIAITIIRAFESLFQQIQEHQGVPLEDRYPALPIAALGEKIAAEPAEDTYIALSDHGIYELLDEDESPANHDSNEPIYAPPGAWPE